MGKLGKKKSLCPLHKPDFKIVSCLRQNLILARGVTRGLLFIIITLVFYCIFFFGLLFTMSSILSNPTNELAFGIQFRNGVSSRGRVNSFAGISHSYKSRFVQYHVMVQFSNQFTF